MPKKYRNRKSLNHRLPSHKGGAGKYPRKLLDKSGQVIFKDVPPTPVAKAAADAKLDEEWGVDGGGAAVDGVDWEEAAAPPSEIAAGAAVGVDGVVGPAKGAELAGVSSWDDDEIDWSAAPVAAGGMQLPPGVPVASSPPTVAPPQGEELTDSTSSWDDGVVDWSTVPPPGVLGAGDTYGPVREPAPQPNEGPGILSMAAAAASSAIDAVSDTVESAADALGLTEKDAPPPVYTGAPHLGWQPTNRSPVGPQFDLLASSERLLDSAPHAGAFLGAAGTASPQSGEPKGYSPVRRSAPPIFNGAPKSRYDPLSGSFLPISDDFGATSDVHWVGDEVPWPPAPSRSRNIYTPRKKRRKSSKRKRKPHRSHKLSRRKIKKQITKKKRELKILRKKLSKSKK